MVSNKLILALLILSSSSIFAQSADLELDVYMETPGSVFSGFEGEFSVTVTNNGPDEADSPGTFAPFMSSANSDYIFSPDFNIVQNDCAFATFIAEPRPPVFPGGLTLLIATNPIAVGDSVTCFGRYAVGFENGTRELFWETVNFGQGSLIDDPLLENNTVTVTLGIQPIPVDALGIFSMLLMMFLLVLGTSTNQSYYTRIVAHNSPAMNTKNS